MAQGIQDIGNGIGYLYKTLPNGTTIIASERNTVDGARSMREQGTANAPVVAQRPAVGTITVNSVAAAGQITAVTIAAVNQISAVPINVTSAVASVVAGQISAAINSFTPGSGPNYTAQAVNDVVYVFSPASVGGSVNGLPITVSVTNPTIVTTTADLTNGSSNAGTYDSALGYRFYINADYSGVATPTSLVNAVEVTEYMTVRGLQTGIVTTSSTIATDRLIGLNRSSAITQIIVDTEASAATDVLAFIQTDGFVVGDEIRLRNTVSTRVPIIEDATVTTSPIATKNIYLVNQAPFSLTGRLSINLQLFNDPVLGAVWVELGRSEVVNGVITRTIATMNADIVAGLVKANALYLITDIGPRGAYVQGLSATEISTTATMTRRVPKGYTDTWRTNITGGVTIGNYYRYNQSVYQSLTGVLGTAPPSAPDWQLMPGVATYYSNEQHTLTLNLQEGVGINPLWPFIQETDSNNNIVRMSYDTFLAIGTNPFDFFPWMESGAPQVRDNVIDNSLFDAYQFTRPADRITGNIITSQSVFILNNPRNAGLCTIVNNIWSDANVTSNVFYSCNNNRITNGTVTLNAVTSLSLGVELNDNSIEDSFISNCEHNAFGTFTINLNVLNSNSSISGCTITDFFTSNVLQSSSSISGIFINAQFSQNNFTNSTATFNLTPTVTQVYLANIFTNAIGAIIDDSVGPWTLGTGGYIGNIFSNSIGLQIYHIYISSSALNPLGLTGIASSTFNSSIIFRGGCAGSYFTNVSISVGNEDYYNSEYVTPTESTKVRTLDLSNPAIFSGTTLTIPSNTEYVGTFILSTSVNVTIDQIIRTGYNIGFGATVKPTPKFRAGQSPTLAAPYGNVTINTTPRATALGNDIIGDAASYTLSFTVTPFVTWQHDYIWIYQTGNPAGDVYAVDKYTSFL